jgi:hypothetical protein
LVATAAKGWVLPASVWQVLDDSPLRLDFAREETETYFGLKVVIPFGKHARR